MNLTSASDVENVRKGGFGVARIHEISDREIAVVIACLVKGTPEDITGDDYFWVKLIIDERPAFILSHRLVANNKDMQLTFIPALSGVDQVLAYHCQSESGARYAGRNVIFQEYPGDIRLTWYDKEMSCTVKGK